MVYKHPLIYGHYEETKKNLVKAVWRVYASVNKVMQ